MTLSLFIFTASIIMYLLIFVNRHPNYGRHLFISKRSGGCNADYGWLVVIDISDATSRYCNFDRLPGKAYPYILYGADHHVARFNYGRSGSLVHG